MSELRYPNESREYRDARDSLLKDEQQLVDKVKAVAEKRRNFPPSGQLKEDYVFQWANDGKVGESVKLRSSLARNRADLNSEAVCKARHQVLFTKTDSKVTSGPGAGM